jgi:hypothetical protein
MQVTAWNNGKHCRSGAGYGLKLASVDRDRHFKKSWTSVVVTLPNGTTATINTDKKSFWNETCRELISKDIGVWLVAKKLAPWPDRAPPRFELKPIGERRFALSRLET